MKQLGVMIVGPGWVAGQHINGFHSDARCSIRAIAGFQPQHEARARRYIEQYQLVDCTYTQDYEQALDRDDIDIVAICTINSMHYTQVKQALRAGKHVLVEKPLALQRQEVDELCALARTTKAHTFVGHVCRYYPAVAALKRCIDHNLIGKVYAVEADYFHEIAPGWKSARETAGSSLLMGGVHAVDIAWWLSGEQEPAEVFAYSQPSIRRPDFSYDPTITAMVKFQDGTLGRFSSSLDCNMPYVFHLQASGVHGTVRSNGLYSDTIAPDAHQFMSMPGPYPDNWDVTHHPFPEEIRDFVDGIMQDTPRDLHIERVAPVYQMIFAAQESAATGRPVQISVM